ncbi:hypothetical protein [Jiella avicenniae]|uniref:Uncharacterized protein n=1 Tax=Jiella avicenniae TaxID=2907202 RepID=A0A9X1TE53_9HYPH|nr:hypothetical protein [Jiella avicenniae]MCE7030928.1 hypothetical protein [Jiella avicenniae]
MTALLNATFRIMMLLIQVQLKIIMALMQILGVMLGSLFGRSVGHRHHGQAYRKHPNAREKRRRHRRLRSLKAYAYYKKTRSYASYRR